MSEADRPFAALPKPEPEEAPAKEPRARRGFADGAFGIFILVILASLAGGLIATYWPWMRASDSPDMDDRLAALETRVGQIAVGQAPKAAASTFEAERRDLAALKDRVDADEARLTGLEKSGGQTAGTDVAGGDLDAIQKSLAQLTKDSSDSAKAQSDLAGRVAALEHSAPPSDLVQRLDSFALKDEEAALDARIAKLESQDPTGTLRRAASILALAGLVRASESDAPFANELHTLSALAPLPQIADLAHYAGKGVPTRAMLAEQFAGQADLILAAERRGNADTWLEKLWVSLIDLVSVRRIGNVKGNDTEARLARAGFDLKAGDLDSAVTEVSALVGPARDAAAPWLVQAKARLAITRDTQTITNTLIAGLPQ